MECAGTSYSINVITYRQNLDAGIIYQVAGTEHAMEPQ